jgi:hypothetical protein
MFTVAPPRAGMLDCYILPEQAAELHKVAAQNPGMGQTTRRGLSSGSGSMW